MPEDRPMNPAEVQAANQETEIEFYTQLVARLDEQRIEGDGIILTERGPVLMIWDNGKRILLTPAAAAAVLLAMDHAAVSSGTAH